MESFPAPWHGPSLTHSLLLWRHSSCLGFPSSGLLPGRPYQGFPFPVLFNRRFLFIFSNKYGLGILGNLFISSVCLHLTKFVGLCLSFRTKETICLSAVSYHVMADHEMWTDIDAASFTVQWRRNKSTLWFFSILFQTWNILSCLKRSAHERHHTVKTGHFN